ncbi:hypothetical protein MGG_17839 [Pyricularia oryzae 70-15]|uniref:Uncharacterized protein n=1 Tax=Pyricularia oryzae (strain 70-15 / ATCC MYA-4617 / FGSC 8958) TaxID=242507 RepID=G4NIH4_PYRO7|nr:uncharacterized protein MGG_17839 [Pyricularia oryzae 70-15]EHA48034.1 hypothetical protein MGG_17839 [Pyricularia oryzae 70-15]
MHSLTSAGFSVPDLPGIRHVVDDFLLWLVLHRVIFNFRNSDKRSLIARFDEAAYMSVSSENQDRRTFKTLTQQRATENCGPP